MLLTIKHIINLFLRYVALLILRVERVVNICVRLTGRIEICVLHPRGKFKLPIISLGF